MNRFIFPLGLACAVLLAIAPARAADEFGVNFTADAPAALEDRGIDYSADDISKIEPAAGEDVFINPEEEGGSVAPGSEILVPPEQPLVPGMTATTEAPAPVMQTTPETE